MQDCGISTGNALEMLQSCILLHEIFTYKNMALSLMQFDSREVSKHHVHDDEEHSNPTGGNKSPDSKVHGANMGPIWGRQDTDGPHVGPTNFAIWEGFKMLNKIIPMSQGCKSMKNNRQLQWYYYTKKYSSLNK